MSSKKEGLIFSKKELNEIGLKRLNKKEETDLYLTIYALI